MTYYGGKKLLNRVDDFGLTELYDYLIKVANGELQFAGPVQVEPHNREAVESVRVTIYSMLNELGIKEQYSVKLVMNSILSLDKKRNIGGKSAVSIPLSQSFNRAVPTSPDDVMGDEGCIDILNTDYTKLKEN